MAPVVVLLAAAPKGVAAQQLSPPADTVSAIAPDSADPVGADPVGFLLEHKDTLRLSRDVVNELVQVNLDLFRRTRRIQRSIDSIMPPLNPDVRPVRRSPSPEQREALAPLLTDLRQQRRRARDAAYALLSPEQQQRARQLLLRAQREQPRRRM